MTTALETPARGGLAKWVIARRHWIAAGWAALMIALLPLAPRAAAYLDVAGGGAGASESEWVSSALATRFGSRFANVALLVVEGVTPTSDSGLAIVRAISDSVSAAPFVTRVLSYAATRDSAFLGAGSEGGTFLVAGLAADASQSDAIATLRETTSRLSSQLRAHNPSIALSWTGAAAFDRDIRRTSSEDAARAERRVLPLTLVLLVVVFGAVVAALLPIGAGALAIGVSLGAAALLARVMPLTILLQNVVSMIGLALGIDYALLLVTRFRESRALGVDDVQAAEDAARHAGHTVIISGATVALGFAALLIVPAAELRSIAVGGVLVVCFSLLIATTLVAGVLAMLGGRIEWGRVRAGARRETSLRQWRRWGRWVSRHSTLVLVVAGTPLVALAWQARRVSTDIPSASWLPARMESTRGVLALQRMRRAGLVQSTRVILELPAGTLVTDERGWSGVLRLCRRLAADARIAYVRAFPCELGLEHPSTSLLGLLDGDTRSSFMSRDERLAVIELVPREEATAGSLVRLVHELRARDASEMTGVAGARIRVGGLPAFSADYEKAIGGRSSSVVLLVMAGSLLALLVGFRSVLVAVKAVLLNLVSVAAALGAAVLVFQDGHGSRLLGLQTPLDGLFPAVPIIVFCVVFGLSMDYEVFLVARVAEYVRSGSSDEDALVEGLARTGGVITSAALVMVLVFAGFAAGDFLIVKILGFTLAVAVLLDATLVRMAVGPALLRLAGRWNWWPGGKERAEPGTPRSST